MCEDLEYSELLDRAAEAEDPYDRMVGTNSLSCVKSEKNFFSAWQLTPAMPKNREIKKNGNSVFFRGK